MDLNNIVVWVDADQVLVDFKEYFHQHLRENYRIDVPLGYVAKDWNYKCLFKSNDEFNEAFNSLPKDWPRHLQAFSGASEFTHELLDLGCRVVVITHLPLDKAPERLHNFSENNIQFNEIYFTWGRDKCDYARALLPRYQNGKDKTKHLFVDDKALNIKQFFDGMPGMLDYAVTMNYPYNSEVFSQCKDLPQTFFDTQSNTPQEMYEKIINRVKGEIRSKKS